MFIIHSQVANQELAFFFVGVVFTTEPQKGHAN